MPTSHRKRAPLERMYSSEPNIRQAHFPSRRRSINATKPTPTNSRTRQQTLTQIDFVSRYVPQDDAVDLNYIEDETPRKRRKTKGTPAEDASAIPKTRKRPNVKVEPHGAAKDPIETAATPTIKASKRRRVKMEDNIENGEIEGVATKRSTRSRKQTTPAKDDTEPPKTPIIAHKVEIPSSQSPADSPQQIFKKPPLPNPLRLPLKAKSANMRNPLLTRSEPRRAPGWHPKLEIKSSVSWENEDSQPVLAPLASTGVENQNVWVREMASQIADKLRAEWEGKQSDTPRSTYETEGPKQPIRTASVLDRQVWDWSKRTEVRDSDDEEEEEEDADNGHNMGNGSFKISEPTQSISDPNHMAEMEPITSTKTSSPSLQNHHEDTLGASRADTQPTKSFTSPTTHLSPSPSAQLTNDLHLNLSHHTQAVQSPTPRLLDSISKSGFLRDYTPSPSPPAPAPASPSLPHLSLILGCGPPTATAHNHPHEDGNEQEKAYEERTSQISTQSPCKTPTRQDPLPYPPPSQLQSSPQVNSDIQPPSSLHQSSPPIPPSPSHSSPSSPSPSPSRQRGRRTTLTPKSDVRANDSPRHFQRENTWDGNVLSVSQLLPASLLDESNSYAGPPPLDEDWVLDMLAEEGEANVG